jgi:peptide deformylase
MELEIVKYGHPALRAKGARIDSITPDLLQLIEDMLETMVAADGVGLAAQQVGRPLQLCVIDIAGITERPSRMWIAGNEVNPDDHMPLVLINPEVTASGKPEPGTEGCLSFPGLSAPITRPARVAVTATNPLGKTISFEATGLLARAVLHENDHLQGVLFIDHMTPHDRKRVAAALEDFLAEGAGIA